MSGRQLKALAIQAGVKLYEVSNKIGMSYNRLSMICSERIEPTPNEIQQIRAAIIELSRTENKPQSNIE